MSVRVISVGAALGLVGVLSLALVWTVWQPAGGPDAADAIAAGLRCPDCQGLSVADSPTQAAAEIRRQIDELLRAGASADEVRAHFVDRYGEWILLAPTAGWVWWLPFALLALGAAGLVVWLRTGGASSVGVSPDGVPAVSEAARARVREEAEALDA